MKARTLPPKAGWTWLTGGLAIFLRNPPLLSLLVLTYWFIIILLTAIPLLGSIVASLLIPGLSVGLMDACRRLERSQPVVLNTLFASLKPNGRTLMSLGGLYLAATLAILGMSALVDGGDLLRYMLSGQPIEREVLESGALLPPAALVMLLLTPLLMAYWFAPVLAAWHQLPAGKALFFSFVACWLNWRPFLVYSLGLLGVGIAVIGTLFVLFLMLLPQTSAGALYLLMFPLALLLAPTVIASFYVSYRDVFALSERA